MSNDVLSRFGHQFPLLPGYHFLGSLACRLHTIIVYFYGDKMYQVATCWLNYKWSARGQSSTSIGFSTWVTSISKTRWILWTLADVMSKLCLEKLYIFRYYMCCIGVSYLVQIPKNFTCKCFDNNLGCHNRHMTFNTHELGMWTTASYKVVSIAQWLNWRRNNRWVHKVVSLFAWS